MVEAKREVNRPGVAYSRSKADYTESLVVSSGKEALNTVITNSATTAAADSVFELYSKMLSDIPSPQKPVLMIFEAFSKLDYTSSLGSKILIAVRIQTNTDRTEGLRVLSYIHSKDHMYGSKVGYKSVPHESFGQKDNEVTRGFMRVSKTLGLEVSFYESPDVFLIRARGQRSDISTRCNTLVEYSFSKNKKPVFRKELHVANEPVTAVSFPKSVWGAGKVV